MNFGREGWFQQYIEYRTINPHPERLPTTGVRIMEGSGIHNEADQAIYYFLQPTGIFFGTPLAPPYPEDQYPRSQFYDADDRAMVTVLDSTFACLVADRHYLTADLVDEPDHFGPAVEVFTDFYCNYPPAFRPRRNKWPRLPRLPWKQKKPYADIEEEFRRRLWLDSNYFMVRDPFANIFLILDLVHCLLWQRSLLMDGAKPGDLARSYEDQLIEREILLKLIVAAVFADGKISSRDRRLVERFLAPSRLSPKAEGRVRRLLKRGIDLDGIEIPKLPWLIRRFFLSQVLTVTMLDRVISPGEERLLDSLVDRLELWDGELDQSRDALSVFLMSQGERMHFHSKPPNLFSLSERIAEKATIAVRRNLNRLVNEIKETQELYELLMKATREKLSEDEKQKVQDQLMDILKTIPALAIFALPGGAVMLPILIRLLPFNLLPSSFED